MASLLDHATAPCPFDYLGLHSNPSGNGCLIRAWQPSAISIEVIEQPSGNSFGLMEDLTAGVFELLLPDHQEKFHYQLKIFRRDGLEATIYDPYQFGEYILKQDNIEPLALYRHVGAFPHVHNIEEELSIDGVLFKVYAPNASSVSVVGDFNQWDGRINPMASADDGIWRLFIPEAATGSLYKFEIHDQNGQLLPLKSDPFARFNEQWPGFASIVHESNQYQWHDNSWVSERTQEAGSSLTIYEVHPGSWKKNLNGSFQNYRELADSLIPYVKTMGYSHIQLMPVSEHPDYESWGYQPVGLFSPTSRYGSPDDLKYFIDQCHHAEIGVILDWVPAQFPADEHGLAKFDGTTLYEHNNPEKGWHPRWRSHIYDYSNSWVQSFLISNALFWLDEFHFDGLRIDAVSSMLYLDYEREHGHWKPNNQGGVEHQEAVRFLQQLNSVVKNFFPGCLTIAEENTSWPKVTHSVKDGGLGFTYQWNNSWLQDSLSYMRLPSDKRQFHHNQLILNSLYSHSEKYILPVTHETAGNGKGSLLSQMPGDEQEQFANLRAYMGFLYGHPGKKSLFMGSELASFNEWSIHQPLEWGLLAGRRLHSGFHQLIQDLNKLHASQTSLHELDHQSKGFKWLVLDDHINSILAFVRYDKHQKPIVVVCNMSNRQQENYQINAPVSGLWHELLNTDNCRYGGNGLGDSIVKSGKTISLNLAPLSTVFLSLHQ